MRRSILSILTLALFITCSAQDFEPGYYTDYSGAKYHGFIRIKKKDGGFRFKEREDSKSERISIKEASYFKMGDREFFVKSFNTFAEMWENISDYTDGDLIVEKSAYFVELIEKGKVNVYVHSDLEFNSLVPFRDREYYLEKGDLVKKMNTDEGGILPLKLFGTLKKYISDDEVYIEKYKANIYKDADWLTLIKDYNNRYKDLPSKKDTVIFFRGKKKQAETPVTINVDGNAYELALNTLVKVEVDNVTDIQLCINNSNCNQVSGSLVRKSYFEVSLAPEDRAPSVYYADQETGDYYTKRIEYLMNKAKKKSSK